MNITVKRFEFGTNYTIGKLYIDDQEQFFCYTLEGTYREQDGVPVEQWKVQDHTAIPKGSYKVIVDHSNHFGKDLPHILDVPGYEGVRIHPGNTDKDTEGCLLVGKTWSGTDFIGSSVAAFNDLFPLIQKADSVSITIS